MNKQTAKPTAKQTAYIIRVEDRDGVMEAGYITEEYNPKKPFNYGYCLRRAAAIRPGAPLRCFTNRREADLFKMTAKLSNTDRFSARWSFSVEQCRVWYSARETPENRSIEIPTDLVLSIRGGMDGESMDLDPDTMEPVDVFGEE